VTRVIELYGRLKESGERVELELPAGTTAAAALQLLGQKLGRGVEGAVLASESAVLGADEVIPESQRLAALPPVCGG
jgi:sulfur carrier protein ThiS